MKQTVITIPAGNQYLKDFISVLPSHCLINKGVTGCGGTTLELESKRDSIILCPTKNLVTSKSSLGYFGVDGNVSKTQIRQYLINTRGYRKIVATYDALEKLMDTVPEYQDYFLLIDEYHLLFNDYSFRREPIRYILDNFRKFKDWAFMTATPLKDEFILEELKDVDQITYQWESATTVNIKIEDTYFIQRALLDIISSIRDKNFHIFLNSVSTIKNIVNKLDTDDYRVVCSENSKTKIKHFAKVTDPIKHLNFYTSCAFEGCDIYDPNGYTIIISDTNIATTILDISTKVRQVCGRIRDSKYKGECTLILNTSKHRYAGVTKSEFNRRVAESEELGHIREELIKTLNEKQYQSELRTYTFEGYSSIYLNTYNNKIFFDNNLKKQDIYNYELITEIYNNSVSVLNECSNIGLKSNVTSKETKGLEWIKAIIYNSNKLSYTYEELENIFKPLFKEHNLKWNKNTSIKTYFPKYLKKQKTINGIRKMCYVF